MFETDGEAAWLFTINMRNSFLVLFFCFAVFGLAVNSLAQTTPAPNTSGGEERTGLVQVTVFESGKDDYDIYRIPSIIKTAKGTLIAVAEGRKKGLSDSGDIDLVMKRSFDGGDSWTKMEVIADDGENTVGNPTQVIDRTNGTIWLLTTRNPGTVTEREIIDGTTKGARTVWIMKSTDEGATWSTPVDITSSVKKSDWGWYATGPGIGIQLKSGRLVIPANHSVLGTRTHHSHIFYSDNHGATWKLGGSAGEGTNESQVAERADGTLLLNMRNYRDHPKIYVRAIAISRDRGLTWSVVMHDPMLLEPVCQASLIRHDGKIPGVFLFSNPASIKRENLTVRMSLDDGRTWPYARQINAKGSAYSNLISLTENEVGLLYEYFGETQPYQKIVFTRFSLDWLRENPKTATKKTP